MQDLVVCQSSATRSQSATMFVALELSRRSWLVAIVAPHADKVSRHKLAAGDTGTLLTLIERQRQRAVRKLGRPVTVVSCYEAGRDGFWLHRFLHQNGIENQVMDPSSIQVDRRARRVKTDRVDLGGLLRTLMAWHRGEPRVCAMVRVPSVAEEDEKRLSRERARLVKERIGHTNRIKGLLATQGITDYEPMAKDRLDALDGLVTGDGRPVPPRLAGEVRRHLRRLELVLEMIAAVETERDRLARAALRDGEGREKLGLLLRLKGIGPEFATQLSTEVFYRQFDNRRQVAAYVGIVPSPFASGAVQRDQGISKAGNARVRADHGGAFLAVAAQSAQKRAQPLVCRAGRGKSGTASAHHDRCLGAQASDRLVALCRNRPCPQRRCPEDLNAASQQVSAPAGLTGRSKVST